MRSPSLLSGVLALLLCTGAASGQALPDASPTAPLLRFADFTEGDSLHWRPEVQALNGQEVRLRGYMVHTEYPPKGQFLFTLRPVMMSEDADGEADDLPLSTVTVLLDAQQRERLVPHVRGLLELQGRLDLGRQEGADGRVSWIRLQLDDSATRVMTVSEMVQRLLASAHAH
jgi:hypothetical protein